MATFPLKLGSTGPEVRLLDQKAVKRFASYAFEADGVTPLKDDNYFGSGERRFVETWQARSHLPVTGQLTEDQFRALTGPGTQSPAGGTVIVGRRKIWAYSAPGSGANSDQGPGFQLGERCARDLRLNHKPLVFPKGGYLGLMGGPPDLSYNEVIWAQYQTLKRELESCPDVNDPDWEAWFFGYSQSADGMEEALEMLFGDGGHVHPGDPDQRPSDPGPFRHRRDRINGLVQFGNPSTVKTGIARKVRSPWLAALVRNVNYSNDFYAVALDEIRPAFYAIIVQAEMSAPFFVHVLKIAMRVIAGMVPIFGGLLGPLGPAVVAGMAGISSLTPMLGGLMGQAGAADEKVDDDLVEMLTVTGLIKNAPGLIGLVGALPGLQAHGGYEFDPAKMDEAFGHIASFRR